MLLREQILKGPLHGETSEGPVVWSADERHAYTKTLKGITSYSVNAVAQQLYKTCTPQDLLPDYTERRLNVKPPGRIAFIEHTVPRNSYRGMGVLMQTESMESAYTKMATHVAESAATITRNTLMYEAPETQKHVTEAMHALVEDRKEDYRRLVDAMDTRTLLIMLQLFDMSDAQEPDYVDKMMAEFADKGATSLVTSTVYIVDHTGVIGPVINQNWFMDDDGHMVHRPSLFSVTVKEYDPAPDVFYARCHQHLMVLYKALDMLNTGKAVARWATPVEKAKEGGDHRVVTPKGP